MPSLEDIRLGQLAVAHGLAQPLEVEECLAEQQRNEQKGLASQLSELLIQHGFITKSQLERLTALQQESVQKVTNIGPYELKKKLGEGGMGAVYQALNSRDGKMVALKVLPRSRAKDNVFLRRFESEARVAFELDHPNIVKGLDVGNADGYHFLVMEYVEGTDVFGLLEQKGRFFEPEALNILLQISSALQHINEEKMVHRDIKPENILVTPNGVAKLTDMGLAVDSEVVGRRRITQAGVAMGTPFYLSPEQIQCKDDIDIRSDIYSLGATAYEMLTGRPPFDGENAADVMMKHLNAQVPSPKDIDRNISTGFCHILEKMMVKDVSSRYQNPKELVNDLKLVATGKMPTTVRPPAGSSSIARPKGDSAFSAPVTQPMIRSARKNESASEATRANRQSRSRNADPSQSPSPASPGMRWVILAGIGVAALAALVLFMIKMAGS